MMSNSLIRTTIRQFRRPLAPLSQQLRTMFIQTEDTPNPDSLKFLPHREVLETTEDFTGFYVTQSEKKEIARSPLAQELFTVDGVKSLYLGSDFVTVTKRADTKWDLIQPFIFSKMMDFYATGKPALLETPEVTDTTIFEDDDEVVAMIKELLETRIRPAVQEDGGDIRYVGFEEETGIVTVQLAGSCVGCPSSSVTLKNGVENMLMHYIPEVTAVHAIEEEGEEDEDRGTTVAPEVKVEQTKQKTYEERLAQAGIPFSD